MSVRAVRDARVQDIGDEKIGKKEIGGSNAGSCVLHNIIYTPLTFHTSCGCGVHKIETAAECTSSGGGDSMTRDSNALILPTQSAVIASESNEPGSRDLGRRSGCSAVAIGDDIFCVGGMTKENSNISYTSDVYRLDTTAMKWYSVDVTGDAPPGKDKFGACAFGTAIVVFAGYGHGLPENAAPPIDSTNRHVQSQASYVARTGGGYVNDISGQQVSTYWNNAVHVLETQDYPTTGKCSWSEVRYRGQPPTPRAACSVTVAQQCAYVFGGGCMAGRRSDIHRLHLEEHEWSGTLAATGDVPSGRSWSTLTASSDSLLILCGGCDNANLVLDDLYAFDTEHLHWSRINPPLVLEHRMWHTACCDRRGDVYIVGGFRQSERAEPCQYVVRVRTTPLTLLELAMQVFVEVAEEEAVDKLPHSLNQRYKAYLLGLRDQSEGATS
ncbi:kelch domain-containing protein 2-like [Sycon ciliatum]|uniref:kelch domain-containing protein 2-like n=1 Tax=Sycon ciliatum TaxID=27933 RepID=UPI0031F64273